MSNRYPIGEFSAPADYTPQELSKWIDSIEAFPSKMRSLVQNLSDDQTELRYREGGWTIREVVHHCADSHLNSQIRFKWTLTEDKPTIKAYFEDRWATLADYNETDLEPTLKLIEALHAKWVILLKSLNEEQLQRSFIHPEHGMEFKLFQVVANYAWHGEHHLAHVRVALKASV
ncbi:YfiT family bacillithiol transferase [Sanyastnella coralliicola]|uniref:YfiT family bacillithiol transferase n=1 Tax=Sanyastnella coralliicola TaxID=3069118 RepID=UPI0027BA7ABC|nr:putative metal-dependent hydrolase [Longitalea sp. SCSIO 12813]